MSKRKVSTEDSPESVLRWLQSGFVAEDSESEQVLPPASGSQAALDAAYAKLRSTGIPLTATELQAIKPQPWLIPWTSGFWLAGHASWDQLAALQKSIYRKRLLDRFWPTQSHHQMMTYLTRANPLFHFDSSDWQNPLQLEAIVEFFLNFNDPWRSGFKFPGTNAPKLPADAGYSTVSLQQGLHLVLIDAFGARLSGHGAAPIGNNLFLGSSADLSKVNPNFDTIYLAGGGGTYRITAVNTAAHSVTLDRTPPMIAQTFDWHIPAGLSGTLPNMSYDVGPGGADGYDHFDGAMFVVKDGVVHRQFRWSSYSSRRQKDPAYKSSLRGNKRYEFESFRSPRKAFINYAFKVTDFGSPGYSDGTCENRFYFDVPPGDDNCPPGAVPVDGGVGKTEIRIHHSGTQRPAQGINSAGCIVSGDFQDLRDTLIDLVQSDIALSNGGRRDPSLDRMLGKDLDQSKSAWSANVPTDSQWNKKIKGSFWLIRPDEPAP